MDPDVEKNDIGKSPVSSTQKSATSTKVPSTKTKISVTEYFNRNPKSITYMDWSLKKIDVPRHRASFKKLLNPTRSRTGRGHRTRRMKKKNKFKALVKSNDKRIKQLQEEIATLQKEIATSDFSLQSPSYENQ